MLVANLECEGVRKSLIVSVVVGEVDSAIVVEIVFGMPIAEGQFC